MQQRFRPAALRDARRRANLTQTSLAVIAEVGVDVIARAEQGRHVPAAATLAAIAAALGVDLSTLFEADQVTA